MPPSYLQGLNPRQREAAQADEGPVLVLAGAGTGKTRTLTARLAHLLACGVPAPAIVAVTFTNKAAREMRDRVAALVDPRRARGLGLGTFHAFGYQLLREHAAAAGYADGFAIYDAADQRALLRQCAREVATARERFAVEAVQARISRAKNAGLSPGDMAARASDDLDDFAAAVYRRYRRHLHAYNAVDFDDLLLVPVTVLEADEALRARCHERFRHLLVDEFQDTNALQLRLLEALAGPARNVCVVGDDDQSIYAWRGAVSANILGFERRFPGARVIVLDQNYRSTPAILALANAAIAQNPVRREKRLWCAREDGPRPELLAAANETEEATLVIERLRARRAEHRAPWADFAVLMRTNLQSRPFEEALRRHGIPYRLIGGTRFFDRKEVRDLTAYLALCVNPRDDHALRRILNTPPRGLGTQSALALTREAGRRGRPLGALLAAPEAVPELPAGAAERLRGLDALLSDARRRFATGALVAAFDEMLERLAYRDYVARQANDALDATKRWGFVLELRDALARFAASAGEKETRARPSLRDFLAAAALLDDGELAERRRRDDEPTDQVTLITLHSAKGLEFADVHLVGLEEGLFPHRRSLAEEGDSLEEERRLFYVGVTRARDRLTLTFCRSRQSRGADRPCTPSRFLGELPAESYQAAVPLAASADGPGVLPDGEGRRALARVRERLRQPRANG